MPLKIELFRDIPDISDTGAWALRTWFGDSVTAHQDIVLLSRYPVVRQMGNGIYIGRKKKTFVSCKIKTY